MTGWPRERRVIGALAALLLSSVLATTRSSHATEEATPSPQSAEALSPPGINPDLLLPRPDGRIVLLVTPDADGHYSKAAVERLALVAHEYGEMPAEIRYRGTEAFVDFKCDPLKGCTCPEAPADPRATYVDVTFFSSKLEVYAWSRMHTFAGSCGVPRMYRIVVNLGLINKDKMLGLTSARLQARGLVHEYGHMLGLCGTLDHCYRVSDGRAGHCRRADCALSGPTGKAKVYALFHTGFFGKNVDDYCTLCKKDIANAKADWASMRAGP